MGKGKRKDAEGWRRWTYAAYMHMNSIMNPTK
jgi:hypothetical protein